MIAAELYDPGRREGVVIRNVKCDFNVMLEKLFGDDPSLRSCPVAERHADARCRVVRDHRSGAAGTYLYLDGCRESMHSVGASMRSGFSCYVQMLHVGGPA